MTSSRRCPRLRRLLLPLAIVFLVAGCGEEKLEKVTEAEHKPPDRTQPLQGASVVGYDGKRVQKSAAQIIEANRQRNQQIEEASKR